ncbi:MAG: hypothetical protein WC890_01330 [Candidatus Margulisiibacteriota bacterium]
MAEKAFLLEKEEETAEDVLAKIRRLDSYIVKTKNLLRKQERELANIRAKNGNKCQQPEIVLKGKIYG